MGGKNEKASTTAHTNVPELSSQELTALEARKNASPEEKQRLRTERALKRKENKRKWDKAALELQAYPPVRIFL